jgi:hypothetical protein
MPRWRGMADLPRMAGLANMPGRPSVADMPDMPQMTGVTNVAQMAVSSDAQDDGGYEEQAREERASQKQQRERICRKHPGASRHSRHAWPQFRRQMRRRARASGDSG